MSKKGSIQKNGKRSFPKYLVSQVHTDFLAEIIRTS